MNNSSSKLTILCNDSLVPADLMVGLAGENAKIEFHEPDYKWLLENIERFDAYYASAHVQADQSVLENAEKLKVIATASTGTDHLDVKFARKKGITVLDLAKEYDLLDSFSATAELGWGLLLSLVRFLPQAIDDARQGIWARQKYTGTQLLGKTIGILGYGRLGKMVAGIANGFRMKVLACDIKTIEDQGVEQVGFDEMLSRSDIISINVHLNDSTRGMISEDVISKTQKGVIIINTSRGAIIDETALLKGLRSGHIAGAGLDVIHGEWDEDLYNHPLVEYSRKHTNLIISPHIGGSTVESIEDARLFMAKKLFRELNIIS